MLYSLIIDFNPQTRELEKVFVWQEHESPYAVFAKVLGDYGLKTGALALEPTTRYFVTEGLTHARRIWRAFGR